MAVRYWAARVTTARVGRPCAQHGERNSAMHLSASITFLFQELPLLARFEAARRAGFAGVEIQRLAEGDPKEMARAARDAGVQVVLVNASSGDYVSGGDGLSCVPGREA